jgi:peptidyl-prolyl cis-trans isomerase-like protein 2
MSVLDKIERVPTDDEDRPLEVIRILEAKVFVDPFKEYQERRERKLEKLREAQQQKGKPVKVSVPVYDILVHLFIAYI